MHSRDDLDLPDVLGRDKDLAAAQAIRRHLGDLEFQYRAVRPLNLDLVTDCDLTDQGT